jgi:predicted RND superfamily exporter protein
LITLLTRAILHRPFALLVAMAILLAVAGWRVSKLEINHNQIDLLPSDLPAVVATKDMIDMLGTVGYLLLPLKGPDLNHVKAVADALAPRLAQLPEITSITYKQDVGFVFDRIGLFIETPDLEEGYKRIRKKVRSVLAKNNPFHIELREQADEPLLLDDLVEKYRRLNKKPIDDPYYVDQRREAVLMVIKPNGVNTDQDFLRRLLTAVERAIANFNSTNSLQATLQEHYDGFAPDGTVTYGYTGSFKRNLDDSETMRAAIVPTGVVAFLGILVYLLIALRRLVAIALLMGVLSACVLLTFAFCEVAIGELNTITAILGSIMLGLGIDYGIHFVYRLREEYTRASDLAVAVEATIRHSGRASLGSAATTAATLFILAMSDFKGFSDFGIITGTGVLLSFAAMYVAIPTLYVALHRIWPRVVDGLRIHAVQHAADRRPFPRARTILGVTVACGIVLSYFATRVRFDYDSRSLLTVNRPSIKLQEEIAERWGVSSDPVGLYTPTIEEAKALFEQMTPVPEASIIDEVVSVFTLVPPMAQQVANVSILQKLRRQLEQVDPAMLDDDRMRENFATVLRLTEAEPYSVDDLPEHIIKQFTPVPASKRYGHGYLTFIYPRTSLYDSTELLAFNRQVATIKVGDHEYHGAGISVLIGHLAEIVLGDGRTLTALSIVAIFLIAWLNFRSILGAVLAMLPLGIGVVWMLGFMAIGNWRINFMNVVVFPLVFGYGISAGVHVYHRYRESGSVMLAVRHTGAAVTASSVTTLIGWAALLVSHHRGLESMGLLACFGVASTLLVSLTVLPALLQESRRWFA